MWVIAAWAILCGPAAAASEPFEDEEIHIEVPTGWTLRETQPGGKHMGPVAKLGPGDASGADEVQVWRIPAVKTKWLVPQAVPATARRGSTKLGGIPAASFVWEEASSRKLMSDARVRVLIRATRGAYVWEIRTSYAKPAGDLSVDRRWNTAMSLIVRGWRWKR